MGHSDFQHLAKLKKICSHRGLGGQFTTKPVLRKTTPDHISFILLFVDMQKVVVIVLSDCPTSQFNFPMDSSCGYWVLPLPTPVADCARGWFDFVWVYHSNCAPWWQCATCAVRGQTANSAYPTSCTLPTRYLPPSIPQRGGGYLWGKLEVSVMRGAACVAGRRYLL